MQDETTTQDVIVSEDFNVEELEARFEMEAISIPGLDWKCTCTIES